MTTEEIDQWLNEVRGGARESLVFEILNGARQRRLAEASCREFQHGSHIDRMPVEDNAPCNRHTTLSVP